MTTNIRKFTWPYGRRISECFCLWPILFFVVPGFLFYTDRRKTGTGSDGISNCECSESFCCDVLLSEMKLNPGAALASLTGYFVGLFVAVPVSYVQKPFPCTFDGKEFHLAILSEIFICGLPNAINSILMTIK